MALDDSLDPLLGEQISQRWLCGAGDHLPFAYVRGRDYYRRVDHVVWAHLDDRDRLISGRSGRVIAFRTGSDLYDPDTEQRLYFKTTWLGPAHPSDRALTYAVGSRADRCAKGGNEDASFR